MMDPTLAWELAREWARLVPRDYRDAALEDLDASVGASVRRWIDHVVDVAGDSAARGPNLVLVGPVGAGKTHAGFAAMRRIFFDGTPSVQRWAIDGLVRRNFAYRSVPDAMARMRDHDESIMPSLMRPQVLFLDDIGTAKPTDWALEHLFNIINTRRSDLRPILATSNFSLEDLERHLGHATFSRLVGDAAVVHVQHQDRRRRPKSTVVEER